MVETISEIIERVSPYYKKKGEPEAEHKLIYDSAAETLEPIYFFILDLMRDFGLTTEKLVDSFSSSPGSGHFSELGTKATTMQDQGSKTLATINTILRSTLNLLYDLRDMKMRLAQYDKLKSKDKTISEAAHLSLKQIWMDKVDILRGQGSINALASGQLNFVTLRDAFLAVKDESLKGTDGKEIDLNDRVKRILKPRIQEYKIWLKESGSELRKRYELERNYLKSQVSSLKLYSRWAKPYLKAAQKLENKEIRGSKNADLVNTFNTILLELTIMGKSELKIRDEALAGNFPKEYSTEKFLKKQKRKFYMCVLVDFYFRGIPQRIGQPSQYVFGGKTEVVYKAYVLSEDELDKLEEELSKSDLGDVLQLIDGATDESLQVMQDEIDDFLNEKDDEEEEENKKSEDDVNPFLALFGKSEKSSNKKVKKSEDKKEEVKIKKDTWEEANIIRPFAAEKATETAFSQFDIYKKAHGMQSFT